jgi:urease accessory protein
MRAASSIRIDGALAGALAGPRPGEPDAGTPAGRPREGALAGPARLEAAFAVRGGRTVLASKMHTAPLKIAKAFDRPRELAVIVMDASPGMLAGDRYELAWTAERDARVYLTNQGNTRVHPSPPGRGGVLTQRFTLREGACVQSMMEPLMLYRDAELTSRTEVDLAPGAVWLSAEVLCPGRAGRGETFAFRRCDSALTVRYDGELIYRSRQIVDPASQRIAAPGAWEDCTHIGTLYCFSDRLDASRFEAAREAAEQAAAALPGGCLVGASRAWRHGIVVMAAGGAAWRLQRVLEAAWRALRRTLLGLPDAVWTE